MPLTGVNKILVRNWRQVNIPILNYGNGAIFQSPQSCWQLVISRLNFGAKSPDKHLFSSMVLNQAFWGKSPMSVGPTIHYSRCLAQNHVRAQCKNCFRCLACLWFGHDSGNCRFMPRSACPSVEHSGREFTLPILTCGLYDSWFPIALFRLL
jgi:hypothetical protein